MKVIILALEPLDTRYTGQWFTEFPKYVKEMIHRGSYDCKVMQVDGYEENYNSTETTPGAFLNFTNTNIWKNNQINKVATMFNHGLIEPGDKIIVTDAWHSGIIQLKYMSELMDVPVEIHSIWHAGSYDPQDFLGRKVKDKKWSFNFERAAFYASDSNYFASNFHIKMITENLGLQKEDSAKMIRTGLPFDYLLGELKPYIGMQKENIILFPHRLAPEKQLDIFKDLEKEMPEYKWIVCQESTLTKDEYHSLLGKSKMVFSANLQETLGISCFEGAVVDSLPLVPDRLSYEEMYSDPFKYPSEWTESWESYQKYKVELIDRIKLMMSNYESYELDLMELKAKLNLVYFNSDVMIGNVLHNVEKYIEYEN
jgi:hypothetical protein